eukprot:COSAG02_NODE_50885_length_313_cov_1.444954_1_plen_26_part_01
MLLELLDGAAGVAIGGEPPEHTPYRS